MIKEIKLKQLCNQNRNENNHPVKFICDLYPNLRFKLQNERVSMQRLWQQCPSSTGAFAM
jgi:hypothetical protein